LVDNFFPDVKVETRAFFIDDFSQSKY